MWGGDDGMKYLMVDISGKVPKYDIALCEALASYLGKKTSLTLLAANIEPKKINCKAKKLVSLVPRSLQNSENKIKRSVKALEAIINYVYLVFCAFFNRPKIIHFQWLPFLEVSSIERYFMRLIKVVSPKSKIWLTVHNIYPHNSSEKARERYKTRFAAVENFFDMFILHLQTSKSEFCGEFGISEARCKVIPHGVFVPQDLKITHHQRGDKLRLVMFGNQSYYKGTDVLVDAIALLPKEIQDQVTATIVGQTPDDYLKTLQEKAVGLDIKFIPKFVPDDVLNGIILESDVIVLPYREISQSGVLLLALYFERPIICSGLPSFKETLEGYNSHLFFEKDSPKDLARVIAGMVSELNLDATDVQSLKKKYSWENIAQMVGDYVQ